MKKKLFYVVASWIEAPSEVLIRHVYGACTFEAEAKGLCLEWLDRNAPSYKHGHKFSLVATEIPEDVIRQCVS